MSLILDSFLVFRKSKDLYLIITQKLIIWNPVDFTMKSGGFYLKSSGFHVKSTQNLINSDVSAKTLQFGWISHEICRISYGFHEIRRISYGFHVKSKDLLQGIVTLCSHLFLSLISVSSFNYGPVLFRILNSKVRFEKAFGKENSIQYWRSDIGVFLKLSFADWQATMPNYPNFRINLVLWTNCNS